ncbi:hypothetical protein FPZ12_018200 [Amycolatopsis acidicola]|uniref:Uncharacterized protein n=1 Tax=Amycolatopsis acidicola TaxID=2596893 RepID=A0A5N0V435_9PSEU|nr:hypothetical protein [Amycolatopsis acidicola]KAA9160148.1 hypothetical protein FPZ12_018200 [Amycolatopsis acidicola]
MSTYIDMNGDPAEIMAKGAQWAQTGSEYASAARAKVNDICTSLDESKCFGQDEIGHKARASFFKGAHSANEALGDMFTQDHQMGENFGTIGTQVVTAISTFITTDADGKDEVDKIDPA